MLPYFEFCLLFRPLEFPTQNEPKQADTSGGGKCVVELNGLIELHVASMSRDVIPFVSDFCALMAAFALLQVIEENNAENE